MDGNQWQSHDHRPFFLYGPSRWGNCQRNRNTRVFNHPEYCLWKLDNIEQESDCQFGGHFDRRQWSQWSEGDHRTRFADNRSCRWTVGHRDRCGSQFHHQQHSSKYRDNSEQQLNRHSVWCNLNCFLWDADNLDSRSPRHWRRDRLRRRLVAISDFEFGEQF